MRHFPRGFARFWLGVAIVTTACSDNCTTTRTVPITLSSGEVLLPVRIPPREGVQHTAYVLRGEVTQGLYATVMQDQPSYFSDCGSQCPVESVSWFDAVMFANALSAREGRPPVYRFQRADRTVEWDTQQRGFRLLTELEWNAISDSVGTAIPEDDQDRRHYEENGGDLSVGSPHVVCSRSRQPMELCGLADNVSEWVWDGWDPEPIPTAPATAHDWRSLHLVRGGAWRADNEPTPTTYRMGRDPGSRSRTIGFRIILETP